MQRRELVARELLEGGVLEEHLDAVVVPVVGGQVERRVSARVDRRLDRDELCTRVQYMYCTRIWSSRLRLAHVRP